MIKTYVYLCIFILLPIGLIGSNLKINGDVVGVNENVAIVDLSLLWDNSWRNTYNYDAVYIFGKYQLSSGVEVVHCCAGGMRGADRRVWCL